MPVLRSLPVFLLGLGVLAAQDVPPAPASAAPPVAEAAVPAQYSLSTGTVVPLSLINSISTKHSLPGDRVYLETSFPVLAGGRIVIPVGSYVEGTVTELKKPGRVKGRAELYVRFDSLILPNGVMRDFRARMGGMDGTGSSSVDRNEGKVTGDGHKLGDLATIAMTTAQGAGVGGAIGADSGHAVKGVALGAAAGAAAGIIAVLVSRGPDAVLARGSSVEMVLDREISFSESDLNFGNYQPPHVSASNGTGPVPTGPRVPPIGPRIPR